MGSGGTGLWRDWDVMVVRCLGQGRGGRERDLATIISVALNEVFELNHLSCLGSNWYRHF